MVRTGRSRLQRPDHRGGRGTGGDEQTGDLPPLAQPRGAGPRVLAAQHAGLPRPARHGAGAAHPRRARPRRRRPPEPRPLARLGRHPRLRGHADGLDGIPHALPPGHRRAHPPRREPLSGTRAGRWRARANRVRAPVGPRVRRPPARAAPDCGLRLGALLARAGLHGARQPGALARAARARLRLRRDRLERRPAYAHGRAGRPALGRHRGRAGARPLLPRGHARPGGARFAPAAAARWLDRAACGTVAALRRATGRAAAGNAASAGGRNPPRASPLPGAA